MKKLLAFVIFLITLIPGLAQTVSDGEYFIQVNTTKKYIAIELSLIHI